MNQSAPNTLQHALGRLTSGHDLDSHEAYASFCTIMDGAASDVEIAALLPALRMKGEAVAEIDRIAAATRTGRAHLAAQQAMFQNLINTLFGSTP